ncbi:MAG: bifunctional 5,10-methylenetetrahydrofolate dehydrogenase/5,10-methenyltetrahydrofolate cyclohydrolase [Tissierellales bacterium]|nr:bifunctional 5,10-methylenetetrahydrofolate dehydrogenase/5,10-methenyltetrahydrofolate cyclohydrolase [Tissierellales bacterium]
MVKIIDGKEIAKKIKNEIKEKVFILNSQGKRVPKIVVVKANNDGASESYTKSIVKVAGNLGYEAERFDLSANASVTEILNLISKLNKDDSIDGIIVQRPLPKNIMASKINESLLPEKDIDGVHPLNMGYLMMKHKGLVPSTPKAVDYVFDYEKIDLTGKKVAIVGRSDIVGKPVGMLMLNRNATVIYCHSKTKDLTSVLKNVDVVIAATGVAHLIDGNMISEGSIVIDVGINFLNGKMVGDVEFESASEVADRITPVPGGIGSITTAMLMKNLMEAYENHEG